MKKVLLIFILSLVFSYPTVKAPALERITVMACPEMHVFLGEVEEIFEEHYPDYDVVITGDD